MGSVLRSFDRGETWDKINTSPSVLTDFYGQPSKLNTIFMLNEFDGWAGGTIGALWSTDDGGVTWTTAANPPAGFVTENPESCQKVFFWNAFDGYIAGEFWHTYSTTNGGATWTQNLLDDYLCANECEPLSHGTAVFDFDFGSSATQGVLVAGYGFEGVVMKTTNSGLSWEALRCYEEAPEECRGRVSYAVAKVGTWPTVIAVGQASDTYVNEIGADAEYDMCLGGPVGTGPCSTSNASLVNLALDDVFRPSLLGAASIGSTGKVCYTGAYGVLRVLDTTSAPTYSISDKGTTSYQQLEGGQFLSSSVGCVIGHGSVISRTTDGGASWSTVFPTGTPDRDDWGRDLAFSSSGQLAVAVGDAGFTAYSSDYGATWTLNAVNNSNYQAVAFLPGTDDALIGGVGGVLRKSTDGGASWSSPIAVGTTETIHAISFADTNVGYLVGSGGAAYQTTDGGSTWSAIGLYPGTATVDFYGIDTWGDGTAAIAVGSGGQVFEKTSSQFVQVDLGAYTVFRHLTDVEVFSSGGDLSVRICGYNGLMLFRDNGTWSSPKSQTNEHHTALSFLSANEGFGIGRQFLITKYE